MFSTWLLTRGQLQAPTPRGKETRPSKLLLRKRWNEVPLDRVALSCRILTYAFGTNSMSPMTFDEYEKLPGEEKEHFGRCAECGEIFDRWNLDEILFHHTDQKHRPDIQYSGSEKLD
jgi:hypothetical protein